MTKPVRVTPYQRLLRRVQNFAVEVKYAHKRIMWVYPKNRMQERWCLADLNERVAAADQLGYDCVLIANNGDLVVQYRKRVDVPVDWV